MSQDMLSIALKRKAILEKKAKICRDRLAPINKELQGINAILEILKPTGAITNGVALRQEHTIPVKEESWEDDISVADMIRLVMAKRTDSVPIKTVKENLNTMFSNSTLKINTGIYNALSFLCNNEEITKLGSGGLSMYKATKKLKEVKVNKV